MSRANKNRNYFEEINYSTELQAKNIKKPKQQQEKKRKDDPYSFYSNINSIFKKYHIANDAFVFIYARESPSLLERFHIL